MLVYELGHLELALSSLTHTVVSSSGLSISQQHRFDNPLSALRVVECHRLLEKAYQSADYSNIAIDSMLGNISRGMNKTLRANF